MNLESHYRVGVIGAGIAGVGLGARLLEAGVDDFVICERNESVGGTWFEHTYPGCACDIPTHLYSYSFARNPNWTRLFPRQEEILDYVRDVAQKRGVVEHIRLGCEMNHSRWDEAAGVWRVETTDGNFTCDFLISAIGATAEPEEPDIEGIGSFAGHRFHSARWDHEHDLSGERVGVIGTGPAAAQFVPRIQPKVGKLVVFQRTPPWVMPHPDRRVSSAERGLYKRIPALQDVQRNAIFGLLEGLGVGFRGRTELIKPIEALGRAHLRRQVSDPHLRAKLEPNYRFGCKRPIMSNHFYPALAADNCEVVTDRIAHVDAEGVVTASGEHHELDTLISATGYRYSRSLLANRMTGSEGLTLGETWDLSPSAYLGSAVPGFPNMFILLGPNSIGINSVIFSLEAQMDHVLGVLAAMDDEDAGRIEVSDRALRDYVGWSDEASRGSVWTDGGCSSYYIDDRGRQFAIYPGFVTGFRRRARKLDRDAYELTS